MQHAHTHSGLGSSLYRMLSPSRSGGDGDLPLPSPSACPQNFFVLRTPQHWHPPNARAYLCHSSTASCPPWSATHALNPRQTITAWAAAAPMRATWKDQRGRAAPTRHTAPGKIPRWVQMVRAWCASRGRGMRGGPVRIEGSSCCSNFPQGCMVRTRPEFYSEDSVSRVWGHKHYAVMYLPIQRTTLRWVNLCTVGKQVSVLTSVSRVWGHKH
ncbi:hypothetical protein F5148DRAFT_152182 [Russula earlei]|uniref:Uncharacterized protein n=1 Tax=Russula earlei TaxID=71964 RepID=A0ACC0U670_9AGAM|nr:hypothetical protein F5148DRAFT_152182 [Russula earlei]